MNSPTSSDNNFLIKLTGIIEANLTNPQFGVSMLAKEMGMSRSNLHRKVNEITKITVSQFINNVRLKKAKELLRHTSNSVSEIAYEVGFSNVSYFIKRFHEFYGYSPGEVGNREKDDDISMVLQSKRKRYTAILVSVVLVLVFATVLVVVFKPDTFKTKKPENTIAVLPPFENLNTDDSIDIDGILQNLRDNLNKINDIEKVVPWISVLQYRNSLQPASEIASKLKVNYLIKPKIRVIDGKINLSITLIEGLEDKLLNTFNHEIDSNNITTVYQKILKEITDEIDVVITPAEKVKIDKPITSNKKAGNSYWKGVDIINNWSCSSGEADINEAVTCFENAIKYDNKFALAYAQLSYAYYATDYCVADKIHLTLIEENADKALMYDPELDMSWIAKALYYFLKRDYELAIHLYEKALHYNPNSELAIINLAFIYTYYSPDFEKSVEYNLLANKLNIITGDKFEQSFLNYRLSQAFRSSGFLKEAEEFLKKSLELNPENVDALVEKSQLIPEMTGRYEQAKEILEDLFEKHSSDPWILRHLALAYYMDRDFENAYKYYKKFIEIQEIQHLLLQPGDNCRIGLVFHKMGMEQKSEEYFKKFENLNSNAFFLLFAGYYSFRNDKVKAFEHMKLNLEKENFPIYNIRILKQDPLFDNIRELPEFQHLLSEIEAKFWKNNERIRKNLKKKGLL